MTKTIRLRFNQDSYVNGKLVFEKNKEYDVPTEGGSAQRWMLRGAVNVAVEKEEQEKKLQKDSNKKNNNKKKEEQVVVEAKKEEEISDIPAKDEVTEDIGL